MDAQEIHENALTRITNLMSLSQEATRRTVFFEYRPSDPCHKSRVHVSPWRSNARRLVNMGLFGDVTNMVIIMQHGRCQCLPPIVEALKMLRTDFLSWVSLTHVRFIGPGIFQRGRKLTDEAILQHATTAQEKFASSIPTITSVSYSGVIGGDVSVPLNYRNGQQPNPFYKMLYGFFQSKMTEVQEVFPIIPTRIPAHTLANRSVVVSVELHAAYLRSIGSLPTHAVERLRTVKLLGIVDGIPWDFFTPSAERVLNFASAEEMVLDFTPNGYAIPRSEPNGNFHIRFPNLVSVTVRNSTFLYDDVYSLFRPFQPKSLTMTEDLRGLGLISPQIISEVETLRIFAKSYANVPIQLPREIATRFYQIRSNVQKVVLVGNTFPFSGWAAWVLLEDLTIDLNLDDLNRLPELIGHLPLLARLLVLYQTSTGRRTHPYTWKNDDDNKTNTPGAMQKSQVLRAPAGRLRAIAPRQTTATPYASTATTTRRSGEGSEPSPKRFRAIAPKPPTASTSASTSAAVLVVGHNAQASSSRQVPIAPLPSNPPPPAFVQNLPPLNTRLRRIDIAIPDDAVVDVLTTLIPRLPSLDYITAPRRQEDAIRPFARQHRPGISVRRFRLPSEFVNL